MSAALRNVIPATCRDSVRRSLALAGARRSEWLKACRKAPSHQREAFAFLLAHMPAADLRALPPSHVLRNLDYAFRVKDEVPCSMKIPPDLFLDNVLPYAQLNERRDDWRAGLFDRYAETARRSASIQDAVLTLNRIVFDDLRIQLHPDRAPRAILSPGEAARAGWATACTLSLVLADACRAVGIPARIVGIPQPAEGSSGLFWVEVWDHGHWHFVAAGIQGAYDVTWFNDLARRADRTRPETRIYAASFRQTDMLFPDAADPARALAWAVDVTERYRNIAPTPIGVMPPSFRPKHYVCRRADEPVRIDGRLDKPVWQKAPWTDYFVDIEGHRKPPPRFKTRVKLLWDDRYLYVGAYLEEPHVWASLEHKNEIIFNDNDFEVFIDPDGDHHNYYEFEVNALNTIWELTLDRPYRDGGPIHRGDNIPGLRSAVAIQGSLNQPADTDLGWSVELAIPWGGLARYCGTRSCPPRPGDQWRLNFSRVEWLVDIVDGVYRKVSREAHPEDNWVWSPQGAIDMHRPEGWGYVQFSDGSPATATFQDDPGWLARQVLVELYYRQRQRLRPALDVRQLGIRMPRHRNLKGPIRIRSIAEGWQATVGVVHPDGSVRELHIRQDSRIWETPGVTRE
jgi:hypothetical protein